MKPQEMTGSTATLMNDGGHPTLVADRIAGQWTLDQRGGGREYKIHSIPEEMLRYHQDAQAAGEMVLAGEVFQG